MTRKNAFVASLGLAGTLLLAACGSDSPTRPSTPQPPPPPPPPAPIVIQQGGGTLEVEDLGLVGFTTLQAGSLDVVLDWTFAANDLDVLVVRGDCGVDQLIADECEVLAFTDDKRKPAKLHIDTLAAGRYTLYAANFGPEDESISYQIVLTPQARSAEASSAPARRVARPRRFTGFKGVVSF